VPEKNMIKKKLKQTNASAHLVQYRFKIREGSLEVRNHFELFRQEAKLSLG